MGYFSNGTEGESYQAKWCNRCLHENVEAGRSCPVWSLHLIWNYEECNKPGSFLDVLIPRLDEGIGNKQCTMFVERDLMSNLALQKFESQFELLP